MFALLVNARVCRFLVLAGNQDSLGLGKSLEHVLANQLVSGFADRGFDSRRVELCGTVDSNRASGQIDRHFSNTVKF
jgi:hypothetical protein